MNTPLPTPQMVSNLVPTTAPTGQVSTSSPPAVSTPVVSTQPAVQQLANIKNTATAASTALQNRAVDPTYQLQQGETIQLIMLVLRHIMALKTVQHQLLLRLHQRPHKTHHLQQLRMLFVMLIIHLKLVINFFGILKVIK